MALAALIAIMALMVSDANEVAEAKEKGSRIEKYALETLALISGANAVAEKGFVESPTAQKRLRQAAERVNRLQKMLPTDSQTTKITKLLELVLLAIQNPERSQEEILSLLTQAESLASLLLNLIANPSSVSVSAELQATHIIGIEPPSGEPIQEAEAMIRFGLTAIDGNAYINSDGILIGSNGDIVATNVTSNAAPSGNLWIVLEGQTKWFQAEAVLRAGNQEQFVKMWIQEIRWGTNPDESEVHVLKVKFETPEIFLFPTPTPGPIPIPIPLPANP